MADKDTVSGAENTEQNPGMAGYENSTDIENAERQNADKAKQDTTGATDTIAAKTDVVQAIAGMGTGDHLAQRFANAPENPQPAPRLDPNLPEDQKVRLEITDSDHTDPANPKVTYVHPEMVGDYLRAGWRRPGA